jgi:DNA-binding transcriptional LysR family regulator
MTKAEIDAFLAVVECGSFSKAAMQLYLGQSTLSGRIQTLENELGSTLFVRGKGIRNAELTAVGWDMVPIAEKWAQLWKETLSVASSEQHRTLSLTALHSIHSCIMPQVCRVFTTKAPSLPLRILSRHSYESNLMVENGEAEAAFVTNAFFSKKIETIPLFREEMFFACNKNIQTGDIVHPSELDGGKEIWVKWDQSYAQWHDYWFGSNNSPRLHTDNIGLVSNFLEAEDCWAIVPISVAHTFSRINRIKTVRIGDPPNHRTIYMLIRKQTKQSESLSLLLECMRTVVCSQGAEWIKETE